MHFTKSKQLVHRILASGALHNEFSSINPAYQNSLFVELYRSPRSGPGCPLGAKAHLPPKIS
jgi:hypothetical protein